jgi:hypothetical protein
VIIIRINSPGNDVISQSNTATAGAVATNTATTEQGSGAGAETHPLRAALAAPERSRPASSAVPSSSGDQAGASRRAPRATRAAAAPVRAGTEPDQKVAPPEVAPRQPATAAPRSASASSARQSRPSASPVPVRVGRAAARAGAGAAHFVSSFAPTPTALRPDKADQVSTAVVMTLLAVVLAVLLALGAKYVPSVRARALR